MNFLKLHTGFSIVLIFASFFSSCQIEKRVHRPGYHVQWQKSKTTVSKKEKQENSPVEESVQVENEPQLSASNNVFDDGRKEATIPIFPDEHNSSSKSKESAEIIQDPECETIVFNSGIEVLVNIEEITPTEIKYVRCDLQNGPLIIVNKSEVHKIVYTNGAEDFMNPMSAGPQAQATEKKKFDGLGLTAFISGIVGLLIGAILFGPLAIIFGLIGLIRNSMNPEKYSGKAFAVIGLILGLLDTVIVIAYLVAVGV
jgi:hypothetical protein